MLQPPRQPQILYAIQGPVYVEPSSLETAILTKPVWRSPEVNSPAFEPPVFVTSAFGPPAYGPSALGPPAFMPSTLGHSAFEASIFGPQLGGSPIVGPLVVRPSIFDQPYNGQPQGTLFKPSSFEQPNVETNKASDVGNKVQVSETGHSQNDEPHVRRNQVDFLVHGELYQNDELDGLSDSKNSDQVFLNDDDSNRRGLNLEEVRQVKRNV